MRRNGNGGKGGNGEGGSVPRWVRTLFDQHEARMAEMERAREESKAEHAARMEAHEARMDEMDRFMRTVQREEIETRRQTREIIAEIARLDAQRAKDRVEFVAALRDIRDSLKGLHGRVSRIEGK